MKKKEIMFLLYYQIYDDLQFVGLYKTEKQAEKDRNKYHKEDREKYGSTFPCFFYIEEIEVMDN